MPGAEFFSGEPSSGNLFVSGFSSFLSLALDLFFLTQIELLHFKAGYSSSSSDCGVFSVGAVFWLEELKFLECVAQCFSNRGLRTPSGQ